MPVPPLLARPPYNRRDVPREYQQGWWGTELGNIQRAIPTFAILRLTNGTYTPVATDRTILCDCTGSGVTIVLQDPARQQGLELIIKKVAGTNAVSIIGTIDSTVNPSLTSPFESMTIQSDGQQWLKLAST